MFQNYFSHVKSGVLLDRFAGLKLSALEIQAALLRSSMLLDQALPFWADKFMYVIYTDL